MPHTPAPKGRRLPPIRKINIDRWDSDGNFTVTVKVAKEPKLSGSRKCYLYCFEHGETNIPVVIDGTERKVRMTFMLYVKIPANERKRTYAQEAKRLDDVGDPKLY